MQTAFYDTASKIKQFMRQKILFLILFWMKCADLVNAGVSGYVK